MSRYRWLRPLKCLETMEYFPSLKDRTYSDMQKLLFGAVSNGDIKGMLNDVIVPKAHIACYLGLYARGTPDQEPNTLPPDLALNFDDLSAFFDRPVVDRRRRGRPVKKQSGWSEDRQLAAEMHRMLAGGSGLKKATSATHAARILVAAGKVAGSGTPESLEKRLVRIFRKYYSS